MVIIVDVVHILSKNILFSKENANFHKLHKPEYLLYHKLEHLK